MNSIFDGLPRQVSEIKAIKDAHPDQFTALVNKALKEGFELTDETWLTEPESDSFVAVLYKFKEVA